jgi:hypothetical protein
VRYGCADLAEAAQVQEMGAATEERFEAALSEARAQGDLSRANVVAILRVTANRRNAEDA